MLTAITGTPGTGKSSVAEELERRGKHVIRATETITPYVIGEDTTRDTLVIDTGRWADEFPATDGIVEGQISHLLRADQVVVLRCRPDVIRERLCARGYHEEKIRENVEAELVDVILVEALEEHDPTRIYEIDTTGMSLNIIADRIEHIIAGEEKPVYGTVDWLSVCQDLL